MTTKDKMELEIVSHCWNYSRLLTYQLSSLVLNPPKEIDVTMTVFFSEDDKRTCDVLSFFGDMAVDNVKWNWKPLDKPLLLRRAIGRNMVALDTKADWVFFTDCDQVFRQGCLDSFNQLTSLPEDKPLVFPRYVNCTHHVGADDEMLKAADNGPAVLDIDPTAFHPVLHTKAIGGVQITRADVLHRLGYCKDVPRFMKPASRFGRTKEDVVFRAIIGTQGEPIDIANIFRMEHKQKGRRWFSRKNKL